MRVPSVLVFPTDEPAIGAAAMYRISLRRHRQAGHGAVNGEVLRLPRARVAGMCHKRIARFRSSSAAAVVTSSRGIGHRGELTSCIDAGELSKPMVPSGRYCELSDGSLSLG